MVNSRDVTERKQAEEEIRKSEKRFRALTQNSSDLISLFSATGIIRYQSPSIERILGYGQDETLGDNAFDYVHPEDLDKVTQAFAEGLKDHLRRPSVEYRFRHQDGSWRWMESIGTNLLADPEVAGYVVNSRDVTERRRAEEALKETEERYRTLVEQIPAVTYIDKATGGPEEPIYTSPQIEGLLGYTAEEWLEGRLWPKRLHPEDKERILAADERFEAGDEPFSEEYRLLARDGSVVWVREDAVLVGDEKGEPLYFQGVILDITWQKEAEETLRVSEERLHMLADAAFEGILVADKGVILEANRALTDMFGYEASEVVGRSALIFVAPEHREMVRQKIPSENEEPYEITGVRRDGTPLDLEVRGRTYSYRGRSVRVTAIRDVTERKKAEKHLEHQAFHDSLTDLPNRQLLLDRLGHALRRTRRRRRRVAVLLMDLDDFKSINDSFGHEVGDLLLMVVAERLKRYLRSEDTLARLGGDEFVVLLEDANGLQEAVRVKERIAEAFQESFVLEGREVHVSASVGIALGEHRTERPEDLLRNADMAMYEAKSDGAFGHRVFDPAMHERVLSRLSLENDLRRAIEKGEFRLFYQPKVRLKEEDTITEVEALLRWEHPRRGLLLPEKFIPLAEETGLIVPLGRWVLNEACRQVGEWQDLYPMLPPLVACVNVSAGQLRYPDLLRDVSTALGKSGVEARSLLLEITESALVEDEVTSLAVLNELRDLGVRFALDDFGSEYSSLSYLMRLPVDFVKIDKPFVRSLAEDPKAAVIVEAIVSLAHSLGLEAVGEGVESAEQLEHLRSMGCDLVQGYHLARPMPSEKLARLLQDQTIP